MALEGASAIHEELERALASLQAGDPGTAFGILEDVLRREPESFDSLNLAGVAATRLKRLPEAIDLLGRALGVQPDHAGAHNNMGIALRGMGRHEAALGSYLKTVDLAPDYAPGHSNLGAAYAELNKHELAIRSFDRSLALRPKHADTLLKRGISQRKLGRLAMALASLDEAVAVAPKNAEALVARGDCLRDLHRFSDALDDHTRALQLDPGRELLLGSVLRRQLMICDWSRLPEYSAELVARVHRGEPAIHPFASLQIFDDPQLQLAVARAHSISTAPAPLVMRRSERIHIGYFSADFHRHPMMHLMSELLALHDRDRFQISAFAFNVGRDDEYTARARTLVDRYVELDGLSDSEAAAVARGCSVDVAIDRKGYTKHHRTGIMANRAAPIQVSYLAYPGTMGADYIDYIIADRVVAPRDAFDDFSEKVVWMPDCYFPRDTSIGRPKMRPSRQEHSLPPDAFVFCSFNQSGKILPETFDIWMRVLIAIEGSVLWLLADNQWATDNLRLHAAARGVDPARLIFAPKVGQQEHLERLQLADLCFDTLPYNAHTTANDALFVGVPILTRPGRTFASRVCASMLTTIGLPDLIAADGDAYVQRAIDLARDREWLKALAGTIVETGKSSPLYDMARYVRALEQAFEMMVDRRRRGLAPEHLAIDPA